MTGIFMPAWNLGFSVLQSLTVVSGRFAHLKCIRRLDRLRLRGLSGAQDEFLLAATAQNLRLMVLWLMPEMPKGVNGLAI